LTSLREKFGSRIRSIRLSRQKSQEEFAELLDISVDFLSLIERGINAPSFENLEAFSARLGIPVFELFTFDVDSVPAEPRQVPPQIR
jgi:transcriptional regulator with XRE-family HTH domain